MKEEEGGRRRKKEEYRVAKSALDFGRPDDRLSAYKTYKIMHITFRFGVLGRPTV
jgi:hypothetical protein